MCRPRYIKIRSAYESDFLMRVFMCCLYLENRILKQILNQIRNDEIEDIRGRFLCEQETERNKEK